MIAVEFVVALDLLIATRGRLGLKPTNERQASREVATHTAMLILGENAPSESGCINGFANARSARASSDGTLETVGRRP